VKPLSIRWRLTLWYGAVLAAILICSDVAIYFLLRHYLVVLTDAALQEELTELVDEVGRVRRMEELPVELGIRFPGHEGYELQVTQADGQNIFQSDRVKKSGLPLSLVSGSRSNFESVDLQPIGHVRLGSREARGPGALLKVAVAVSLAPNDRALRQLFAVLFTTGPLALAGALAGGYMLARKALAPVDQIVMAAAEITATRLDRRLRTENADDELGRLAKTLNDMIERLERSFDEVRRFTADAAHELRSPLSIMRTTAEVALRAPRSSENDKSVLEDLLEEIERLSRLVSQLLFLCREDGGLEAEPRQAVGLDVVVREVSDHMQVIAHEKRIGLEVECSHPCVVHGDHDRLRQLLFNLLDNAIKYTPPGGTVSVRNECANGSSRIVVTDTGIGITVEHLPHIFDRFYRVDPARGSEDGTGLGLAICRSIADAHQGQLLIASRAGQGTTVTLSLPTLNAENQGR
jgi:two-component system heavy metal sensor histidine kinase CusS